MTKSDRRATYSTRMPDRTKLQDKHAQISTGFTANRFNKGTIVSNDYLEIILASLKEGICNNRPKPIIEGWIDEFGIPPTKDIEMPSVFRLEGVTETTELDLSTHAPSILAINGVFCSLAVLVVAARIYVRAVMLKTVGADDYIMAGAALCSVGVFICFVGETQHGLGMHLSSITYAQLVGMLHFQFFLSLIVTLGISLIKISVGFFLLRLVPGKAYKWFLYAMITFLVAFTFSSEGTIFFSCIPIRASWDSVGEPNAKCFSNQTFTAIGLFNSAINVLTDVVFATLPLPMVWNLQVNVKTKTLLVMILSLGYFACAASITKIYYQTIVLSDTDSTRDDSYFIWNAIELYIGILAASLPSLRPLFKSILANSSYLPTYLKRPSGTGTAGGQVTGKYGVGSRHRYYVQDDGGGIGLQNMPGVADKTKYDAKVVSTSLGDRSDGEGTLKGSGDSTEDILPMQGSRIGITRTVDVRVG